MRVAVTGGAGFLGQMVVRSLRERGDEAVVIDRRVPTWQLGDGASSVVGDVCDRHAMTDALQGCEVLLHSAFAPPYASVREQERVNSEGVSAVLDAATAAGVRRAVIVSSTIVERKLRRHPLSKNLPASRLVTYAKTRQRGEQAALVRTDISVGVARPRTLVGAGAIGAFALQLRNVASGQPVVLFGPGSARYQLLHVGDFASALTLFARATHEGVLEFGSREVLPFREEMAQLIEHAATTSTVLLTRPFLGKALIRVVPLLGLPPAAEIYESLVHQKNVLVNNDAAYEAIGWKPLLSNVDSLIDAYDWYISSKNTLPNHPVPRSHALGMRLLNRLARL